MLHVQCNACKAFTLTSADPDGALTCGCCPVNHNHGHAANETGKPCRPVTITVMPGTANVKVGG